MSIGSAPDSRRRPAFGAQIGRPASAAITRLAACTSPPARRTPRTGLQSITDPRRSGQVASGSGTGPWPFWRSTLRAGCLGHPASRARWAPPSAHPTTEQVAAIDSKSPSHLSVAAGQGAPARRRSRSESGHRAPPAAFRPSPSETPFQVIHRRQRQVTGRPRSCQHQSQGKRRPGPAPNDSPQVCHQPGSVKKPPFTFKAPPRELSPIKLAASGRLRQHARVPLRRFWCLALQLPLHPRGDPVGALAQHPVHFPCVKWAAKTGE